VSVASPSINCAAGVPVLPPEMKSFVLSVFTPGMKSYVLVGDGAQNLAQIELSQKAIASKTSPAWI
jgi:hypothetical protein